ncbi:unnamed protein product [Discosporangium mesarthrocarpum]
MRNRGMIVTLLLIGCTCGNNVAWSFPVAMKSSIRVGPTPTLMKIPAARASRVSMPWKPRVIRARTSGEEVRLEVSNDIHRPSERSRLFPCHLQIQAPDAEAEADGLNWWMLGLTPLLQIVILACVLAVVGDTTRNQLWSAFDLSPRGVLLGLLALVPPAALGWLLDQTGWDWVKEVDSATREITIQMFGRKRRLGQVIPVSIVLGALIGFSEESTFRGLLPLFIMLKAKMIPPVGVVGICSFLFGILHPASLGYVVLASLYGVYFHVTLLLSGNLLVPVMAHGLYDAFAFVFQHFKNTPVGRDDHPTGAVDEQDAEDAGGAAEVNIDSDGLVSLLAELEEKAVSLPSPESSDL